MHWHVLVRPLGKVHLPSGASVELRYEDDAFRVFRPVPGSARRRWKRLDEHDYVWRRGVWHSCTDICPHRHLSSGMGWFKLPRYVSCVSYLLKNTYVLTSYILAHVNNNRIRYGLPILWLLYCNHAIITCITTKPNFGEIRASAPWRFRRVSMMFYRHNCACYSLTDLGFFRGGDFGNPSERSVRALRGSGLTGELNLSIYELGRGHD